MRTERKVFEEGFSVAVSVHPDTSEVVDLIVSVATKCVAVSLSRANADSLGRMLVDASQDRVGRKAE
jgi:hypothetical protein